jgi:hypothetical protein
VLSVLRLRAAQAPSQCQNGGQRTTDDA